MINMIWAMDQNWLIGIDNQIPWHIKEDLVYYRNTTKGKTVLMGEMTYYSLKSYYKEKPLPYGKIFVASINDINLPDATIVPDLVSFLKNADEEIFIVGGRTIYKLALPYADKLYISFIKGEYKGNVYFPNFDLSDYELISKNETDAVIYTVYLKKK